MGLFRKLAAPYGCVKFHDKESVSIVRAAWANLLRTMARFVSSLDRGVVSKLICTLVRSLNDITVILNELHLHFEICKNKNKKGKDNKM